MCVIPLAILIQRYEIFSLVSFTSLSFLNHEFSIRDNLHLNKEQISFFSVMIGVFKSNTHYDDINLVKCLFISGLSFKHKLERQISTSCIRTHGKPVIFCFPDSGRELLLACLIKK